MQLCLKHTLIFHIFNQVHHHNHDIPVYVGDGGLTLDCEGGGGTLSKVTPYDVTR